MEDGDTESENASRVIQDFVFLCRKIGSINGYFCRYIINTHYYFSNLIRWVGSRRVGAPGTTGSHETKSSVIRSFLAHPRDVIRPIGSSY